MSRKFEKLTEPLRDSGVDLSEHSIILHEMFASTVSNAPDNETDNFTAKRVTPVYLALCRLLENIRKKKKKLKN
jgi:hypothetical protein